MKKVMMNKAGLKHKKVVVNAKKAKIKQDLGGGFRRFVYTFTVNPFNFFTFTFTGGAWKPVSGGWWIANDTSQTAYAVSNYSWTPNNWRTVVYNPTSSARTIAFTIIAKV